MRPAKVKLKPQRYKRPRAADAERALHVYSIPWSASVPFFRSRAGLLVHRVRFAQTVIYGTKKHHDSAIGWCSFQTCNVEFMSDPTAAGLLCSRCEANAVAHGEKPADALVGRHVCKGTLKAWRVCCNATEVKNDGE